MAASGLVSVARNIKPLTMLSSNVKSIYLPNGLHDLTALDDETVAWLLNTSHEI